MNADNKAQDLIDFKGDFSRLCIEPGDTILIRAGLKQVGSARGQDFLESLLGAVGVDGTIVSLAFTKSVYLWNANKMEPFTGESKSYAGALPNRMLKHPGAFRSQHPTCSFVAIGRHAKRITDGHGPGSNAYEPVRTIMELGGKLALVGCVRDSPGFTTAHLAEYDLGLHRRVVFPSVLGVTPYLDEHGHRQLFRRRDPGLCSNSYWKFYAYYVREGVLNAGLVGNAYSIVADANACYRIEKEILAKNAYFTICDNPLCATCNVLRWDRLHRVPAWFIRRFISRLSKQQ